MAFVVGWAAAAGRSYQSAHEGAAGGVAADGSEGLCPETGR
jgi:hypothetical protein